MKTKYKNMIKGYALNQEKDPKTSKLWIVYILECGDSTYYTGITNNLERRFKQHSEGRGARYTRSRGPLKVMYQENCSNRSEALIRECAVKALSRDKKISLMSAPILKKRVRRRKKSID